MIIALVAIAEGTATAGTIASAAGGVIASIVGAFFGKVGTDQTKNAVEGERQQAAKAAVFAPPPGGQGGAGPRPGRVDSTRRAHQTHDGVGPDRHRERMTR